MERFASVLSLGCGVLFSASLSMADEPQLSKSATSWESKSFSLRNATNPQDLGHYLREFHRHPRKVMWTPLMRRYADGRLVEPGHVPEPFEGLASNDIFDARNKIRAEICRAAGRDCESLRSGRSHIFAAPDRENQVTKFLIESSFMTKLTEMEKAGLTQVTLEKLPWSDSFWPMQRGLVARRWRDPGFPNTRSWIENYTYYLTMPPFLTPTENLSPAEKYDLVIGDMAFSLTESMWARGRVYHEQGRNVPGWAGLCDGWSPASFMSENPTRSVTVETPMGQLVTFYPSDIKALASLAWANARPAIKQAGRRCKERYPKEDAVGRILDSHCFDVNPATWHIAAVNQLGVAKRSFVFDATYDEQVWNYPVAAYRYTYFNPQTLATTNRMRPAVVRINDYKIDKFSSHRAPNTQYVVGVAMDLTYAIPTQPSVKATKMPLLHTVKYVYDLELDDEGNIIGGEWYSNFRPDFIWNIPPDARPISSGEGNMDPRIGWDGLGVVPLELREAARTSSQRGQPLSALVEALVRRARETSESE